MKFAIAGAGLIMLVTGCSPAPETAAPVLEVPPMVAEPAPPTTAQAFVETDFAVPTLVQAEGFKLVPLGPDVVKVDFDAYMSSIDHLQQTFTRSTSWPHAGITDADAMLDMETEQARFANRESFAYAVLTADGSRERGSVYVKPSSKAGYDAEVQMWVTKAEFDAGFDSDLFTWVTAWIKTEWPFQQVAYPGRAIVWEEWDALPATVDAELLAQNLKTAEGFIDAFYSFDAKRLGAFLSHADETAAAILYYQGWAEGGNYKVLNRAACAPDSAELFRCAITVQDDPVVALQTGFNVTDTFALTFDGTNIASIKTSSNDQPIYYEARAWVEENMPEVMAGPCKDRKSGGLTPGDCARAMTKGYALFYAEKSKASSGSNDT
jgi:hypothetical protein